MHKITLQHVEQQWDSFCGPATLAMLLSQHNIIVEQKNIVKAANISKEKVEEKGMRMDQLALAVRKLAPEYALWGKHFATLEDLVTLINVYRLACGVEWQEISTQEELADMLAEGLNPELEDNGHYSVITGINLNKKQIVLQNPSYYAHKQEQTFSFEEFESRWFDTNDVDNHEPEEAHEWAQDEHLVFLVAPKNTIFPASLGLKKIRVAPTYKRDSLKGRMILAYRNLVKKIKALAEKLAEKSKASKIIPAQKQIPTS